MLQNIHNLTPSEPTAWWWMGRKDLKRFLWVKRRGPIMPFTNYKLITIALVIAVLVTVFVSVLMVPITPILVLRAAHTK